MGFLLICVSWLFGAPVDEERMKSSGRLIFGIVCFALVLSFVGTVLGGLWADDSWGRFWGWDPKETFALESFVIFAILIHIRLTAKDRGFWTAILAVIGCIAMLFNWIVINFTISGLHSYA